MNRPVRLAVLSALLVLRPILLWAGPAIFLDGAKTSEPISPYLYGQFLEHVGRSIQGGLWAEMLEDRKFLHPVTPAYDPWGTRDDREWGSGPYRVLKASPWKILGPAGSLSMLADGPAGSRPSPRIGLPGDGTPAGLTQDGLALEKARSYSGRAVIFGDRTAGPIEVRLTLDDGTVLRRSLPDPGSAPETHEFAFTAPAQADNASFSIVGLGRGSFSVRSLSLMPADNLNGWRRDAVGLLRDLGATVYRWPGGNFVSGYDWRDGIGPRDERPPRPNPAWAGVESNDVGIHEFLDLTRLLGAEPYVAVNMGLGTPEEAAALVEYANASTRTALGRLRAQNGRPPPFGVSWWGVGNEMFGNWQLGFMPVARYVKKHNQAALAMKAADPSIRLVAVGDSGSWDRAMLENCAARMDLLSEHIYAREDPDPVRHTRGLAAAIRKVAEYARRDRRAIPGLAARDIRIAMDEWNYWYGPYLHGELGVRYHLKDALGVARGLHEFFRNSDIFFMANYAQTVNALGAVKVSRSSAALDATALPLLLYRREFGTIPIRISSQPPGLDVAAAWSGDRTALTVAIVNPGAGAAGFSLDWRGPPLENTARRWIISGGGNPESFNEPGRPPSVTITRQDVALSDGALETPAFSISLYRVRTRPSGAGESPR